MLNFKNIFLPCLKKIITFLSIFMLTLSCFGQERLGVCNSPFAGVTGLWINPASMVHSPYKWDLNLITANAYLDNNYAYIYQTNAPNIASDKGNTPIYVNNDYEYNKGKSSKYMVYNKEKNSWRKNFYLNVLAQGPSLMVSLKNWSFALGTSVRSSASLIGLNKIGSKLIFEGLTYEPLQNIDIKVQRARVNFLSWHEIAFSAGREIKRTNDISIKAGISYKYIRGLSGAYFLNKEAELYVPNDSDLYFNNIDARYGYSINEDNFLQSNGKGHALDLGIIFEKKALNNAYQCPNFCNKKLELQYSWKLGISLLDIGYVRFNKNAQKFLLENKTDKWYNFSEITLNSITGFDTLISQHFNDASAPLPDGDKFTMLLPMALSIQYDYNLGYNFYVNATWVQRIPHFGAPGVDRVNFISVTPRFDSRRFSIAFPITMYQYLWPRIGVAVRLNNFLFVGTDKLGAFLGNRLSGVDIYAGLKINVLKKCSKKKNKSFFGF